MNNKIYVGNLTPDTTDSDLRHAFTDYGVTDASLVIDRETGISKGFAFLTLESEDAALDAMDEMDGTQINGAQINVNEARERRRYQPRRSFNPQQGGDSLQQAIFEVQGALKRLSAQLSKQQKPKGNGQHRSFNHYDNE